MRYLTHQFAHLETLDRARRWLVHAGFDPSQIEVMTDGIPRIAVKVAPGQAAEAEFIIDAVELTDPEGLPSFWDLARQPHVYPEHKTEVEAIPPDMGPKTFVVGYRVPDERPELGTDVTAIEMRDAYLGWLGD
jgi:hypothetical protein